MFSSRRNVPLLAGSQALMRSAIALSMSLAAAVSTLSAGWLCDRYGWATLNLAVVPFLALASLASTGVELKTARLRGAL